MKILVLVLLGIFALNALVILGVAVVLLVDHWKSKRKKASDENAGAHV